eukprot:7385933-Prymnesium_polylepis.2
MALISRVTPTRDMPSHSSLAAVSTSESASLRLYVRRGSRAACGAAVSSGGGECVQHALSVDLIVRASGALEPSMSRICETSHEKHLDTGAHLLVRDFLLVPLVGVAVGVRRCGELHDAADWLLAVGIGDLSEVGLGLLE